MEPQQLDLAPPKNWQDFEDLCHALWELEWSCPTIQKHGRSGDNQSGVDIYGKPAGDRRYHGIQCKVKSRQGTKLPKLTRREIEAEIEEAKKFEPPLAQLIIATTAPSDKKIQKFAREVSAKHAAIGLFSVDVLSWHEIQLRIAKYPELVERLLPGNASAAGRPRSRTWWQSDLVLLPPSLNVQIHSLIALRRKLLIEGFWGDFPQGGVEGHAQYARRVRTEIARRKPELEADIKAVDQIIPIPRDEYWLDTENFHEISMGLASVRYRGRVMFLNEGVSALIVRVRKEGNLLVSDPAWEQLVRDRIPENSFDPNIAVRSLSVTIGPANGEQSFALHQNEAKEVEIEVTLSLDTRLDRIDPPRGAGLKLEWRAVLELIVSDALRSYMDGQIRDVELCYEVMGFPIHKKFELNPEKVAVTRADPWAAPEGRVEAEIDTIHKIDVRDLAARWQRIQTVVDEELARRGNGRRS